MSNIRLTGGGPNIFNMAGVFEDMDSGALSGSIKRQFDLYQTVRRNQVKRSHFIKLAIKRLEAVAGFWPKVLILVKLSI